MKPVSEIFPLLDQPKKIVIVFHQKPDADAMGSGLGLFQFLIQFGHSVTVISPTNWAAFLNWMPGSKEMLDFELHTAKSKEILGQADWIFCLDFNVLNRTRNMEGSIAESNAIKILIDHHEQPQIEAFDYGVSLSANILTAEMCVFFFKLRGN